ERRLRVLLFREALAKFLGGLEQAFSRGFLRLALGEQNGPHRGGGDQRYGESNATSVHDENFGFGISDLGFKQGISSNPKFEIPNSKDDLIPVAMSVFCRPAHARAADRPIVRLRGRN